jgi:hypothetical protein
MTSVQGADAYGEGKVEASLIRLESERFGRRLPEVEDAGPDLLLRAGNRLGYRRGGPVDPQYVAGPVLLGHGTGGCPGSAPDLQYA